jgi:hypothetical protein
MGHGALVGRSGEEQPGSCYPRSQNRDLGHPVVVVSLQVGCWTRACLLRKIWNHARAESRRLEYSF